MDIHISLYTQEVNKPTATCDNETYVQINQRDAALLMNDLYFPLFDSKCFGLSQVHHKEHHLINCKTHWYVRACDSSCCVDAPDNGLVIVRNM